MSNKKKINACPQPKTVTVRASQNDFESLKRYGETLVTFGLNEDDVQFKNPSRVQAVSNRLIKIGEAGANSIEQQVEPGYTGLDRVKRQKYRAEVPHETPQLVEEAIGYYKNITSEKSYLEESESLSAFRTS